MVPACYRPKYFVLSAPVRLRLRKAMRRRAVSRLFDIVPFIFVRQFLQARVRDRQQANAGFKSETTAILLAGSCAEQKSRRRSIPARKRQPRKEVGRCAR